MFMRVCSALVVAAPDLCILAGLFLIGVGVYRWTPEAIWIYAGVTLIVIGVALARGEGRR